MAADVKINSLDLLKQYQGHFRNFADSVDICVVAYRDHLKKEKEEAERTKQYVENSARQTLDKLDQRVRQLEDLQRRFTFSPEDNTRIELEKERYQSRRGAIIAKIEAIKEKLERQISILDDIWNLTYSYGNKTREMTDTANGSLTGIIETISNYQAK